MNVLLVIVVALLGYIIVWPGVSWLFSVLFSFMLFLSKLALTIAIALGLFKVFHATLKRGPRRRSR